MKASERCKEHYQGDRCKLEQNHSSKIHVGSFNRWTNAGDVERTLEGEALCQTASA